MRITVLMEDHARAADGVIAEHGLSLYIETEKHKLLMDTGASDLTWENAKRLGVPLREVDTVVISHGHYDHAGGLLGFVKENSDAKIYMQRTASGKFFHRERYIGIDQRILELPNLQLLSGDLVIDEELSVFTNIRGRRSWPAGNRSLKEFVPKEKDLEAITLIPNQSVPAETIDEEAGTMLQDEFVHEQCLLIRSEGKIVLISGCAHNGVLNILDRYREICDEEPDVLLSGFHMAKKSEYTDEERREIEDTARELVTHPTVFYTGHCTGQRAFDLMKPIMGEALLPLYAGREIIL